MVHGVRSTPFSLPTSRQAGGQTTGSALPGRSRRGAFRLTLAASWPLRPTRYEPVYRAPMPDFPAVRLLRARRPHSRTGTLCFSWETKDAHAPPRSPLSPLLLPISTSSEAQMPTLVTTTAIAAHAADSTEPADLIVQAFKRFANIDKGNDRIAPSLAREALQLHVDAETARNEVATLRWQHAVIEEQGRHAVAMAVAEAESNRILAELRHEECVRGAQRNAELAALRHELALQRCRGDVTRTHDEGFGALKRECERIALDVSTGTVLFDAQNRYHGFAALKHAEAAKTLAPLDAIQATVDALIWRRHNQRELTVEEAQAFVEQYERVVERAAHGAAFSNAQSVLQQFGIGTEDDYASE